MAEELVQTLTVEPEGGDRFTATTPDWFGDRVFGGVTIGQALAAAMATVDGDDGRLRPHSLHGYFLGPTRAGSPVGLGVERLRDGRSFTTRRVAMRQGDRTVFTATCSFHADEAGDEYQLPMPETLPGPDQVEPLDEPGPFDERFLGPTRRRPDGSYESTGRAWLRCAPGVPPSPAAHLAVGAYLSDMTGTSFRPHSLGEWGGHTDASLDHAVWFHRPFRVDRWLFSDFHALINNAGRSVVRGSMYQDGLLCVSMVQELLIRPLTPSVP